MEQFDITVIGSGPGGYVAAIRAAQLGFKVACIEKDSLGGTCLNIGCIPSKALLHSTEYYEKIHKEGKEHGIEATGLSINFQQMMERKKKVVKGLVDGVGYLFKKNKITSFKGAAHLDSPNTIRVNETTIQSNHIILATGSEPIPLPFLPFDERVILSSTGALELAHVPKKMVLIGAGVIGLELGSVYRRLGSELTVIELLDRPCPLLDRELSKEIHRVLKKQGLTFHFSTKITSGKVIDGKISLTALSNEGKELTFDADAALIGIGRRPFHKGLGLEELGVSLDIGGRVVVDANFRTNHPSIYAIGDLIDGPMLAHKASEEGVAAVEIIAGKSPTVNYSAIPSVMYTWPEVASVGMSEEEARDSHLDILIGKFPFSAVPRARCSGDTDGFVKVIAEKTSGRLIGIHIIGPSASEMIGEGVIAIEKGMTVHELAYASHAHPTCLEAIKEAALTCLGQTIHM